MDDQRKTTTDEVPVNQAETDAKPSKLVLPKEIGGREGLEPTRYGDWEKNGRCIDF
jgi:hypothetical protein